MSAVQLLPLSVGLAMMRLLLLALSSAACLGSRQVKVHLLAPRGYWEGKVSTLNRYFDEYGLNPLVEPLFYAPGDMTSEAAGAQEIVDRFWSEPNSASLRHVVLVVPTLAVKSGDYSMYQDLIDSGALVIWFSTYLKDGVVGPSGTVVFCPDDYSGGQFVALRFCTLAATDPSPKKVALVTIPGATYMLRGFQDGIASYCGSAGHDLTVVEPTLNSSASNLVDSLQVPTTTWMASFLTSNPSVNAVFSPSQYVTVAVIDAAQAVRSSSTDSDGLGGLMLNGWHNKLESYLLKSKIYADIDRARSSYLSLGIAKFIRYENLDGVLAQAVATPIKKRVPTMDGFVKAKLLSVYDKTAKPPVGHEAVSVGVEVTVKDLKRVDSLSKEITVKLEMKLTWRERRLMFDEDEYNGLLSFDKSEVWYPKVAFRNQEETVDEFWRAVTADSLGNMAMKEWMSVVLSCPEFNMANFPADRQECPIEVMSLDSHGLVQLTGFSQMSSPFSGSGFTVETVRVLGVVNNAVVFMMDMARNSQPYIITHQIPGILFVLMGFSSFWIPNKAVPARVTLAIVMVLVTLSLWQSLPRAGTILDKWFITNLVFQAVTFFITVCSTNSHFNGFLRQVLFTDCCARRKAGESARTEAQEDGEAAPVVGSPEQDPVPESRLHHMLCYCACGLDHDMVADSLARRFVPLAYCAITAVFFLLME